MRRGDIDAEVAAEAERLETEYDKHRLAQLIQAGGVEGGEPCSGPRRDAGQGRRSEDASAAPA